MSANNAQMQTAAPSRTTSTSSEATQAQQDLLVRNPSAHASPPLSPTGCWGGITVVG